MGDYSNGRERRLKSVSVLVQIQNRLPTEVDTTIFIMRILDDCYVRNLVYGELKGSCLK